MVYYIAFLLFSTISHGMNYYLHDENVRLTKGCSWYGAAPSCPSGNSCPSNLERLDCDTTESNYFGHSSEAYENFGATCWWGMKSYCCPPTSLFYGSWIRDEYDCEWVSGDGNGIDEKKIGEFTGVECLDKCMNYGRAGGKDRENVYNGATIKADGSAGCWCEKGMTGVTASSTYKSCLFRHKLKSECKYDASNDVESGVGTVSENERLKATNKELQDTLRAVLAN